MKQKKTRYIIMLIFGIAIVTVSVAYAALRSNLTVQGSGKVVGNWDIQFQDISSTPALTLEGDAEVIKAELSDTVIELQVSVAKPKDSITYVFKVKNEGNIDAKISYIDTPDIEALAANNLTYSLTYSNGAAINVGDTLNAGDFRELKLVIHYNYDATSLDANPSSFSLDSSILYVQA